MLGVGSCAGTLFRVVERGAHVRRVLAAMLLATSVVAASADADGLGATKVRLVAIDKGATLQISGSAAIPASLANARGRRFVVVLSLSGDGHTERFRARLNHGDSFALTHATKLSGILHLRARVRDGGRPVGPPTLTTVTVALFPSGVSPTVGTATSSPGLTSAPPPTPEQPQLRTPEKGYVVPCSPAAVPAVEPGMGIVTGSFHLDGGPYPGEYVCTGATVTVTTLKGDVVGTAQVGSTESYAIAVPAGTYLVNAVATEDFENGQPAAFVSDREISVTAGGTQEISFVSQIA
jgi:hypothetical protein